MPGNMVGLGAEGEVGIVTKAAEDAGGGGGQVREPFGEAGPAGPVTVFIPPTVFEEEDAVFDLPMATNLRQQFVGANILRVDAGQEISRVGQMHGAVLAHDIAIDAQGDLTAGKGQSLANVLGIV